MSCPDNLEKVDEHTKIDELPQVFYVEAVRDNDVKCEGPFMLTYSNGQPGVMRIGWPGTTGTTHAPCKAGGKLSECRFTGVSHSYKDDVRAAHEVMERASEYYHHEDGSR